LNGHSAQGDIKKVEETIKNTFADQGNASNIFSEMFSSGDKFGQAVKGFFDFVSNCKQNKEKIQEQCEEIAKQHEESLNKEEEPVNVEEEPVNVEEEPVKVEEKAEDNSSMYEPYPIKPGQFEKETGIEQPEEISPVDLEKIQYLSEMFPQYPENLMKNLVKQHPSNSLSDLIDLIVAEQFY